MKTIVFAGGMYENVDFYGRVVEKCDLKIAADSGAEFMRKMNLLPDVLIGDMDSISVETLEKCEKEDVKILRFPTQKDEIDTELALMEAKKRGAKIIFVAGAFGSRLDQTIAVFRLMERFKNVVLFNEKLYSIVIDSPITLKSIPGEIWSVISLKNDVNTVSLRGFKYPLTREKMGYLHPYGVSNEAIFQEVRIDPGDGKLLIFRYHNGLVDWFDELTKTLK